MGSGGIELNNLLPGQAVRTQEWTGWQNKTERLQLDPTRSNSVKRISTPEEAVNLDALRMGCTKRGHGCGQCCWNASRRYTACMDRLWTPWRYSYIMGATAETRKGVPAELEDWPGEDAGCVFCNLIRSVEWGIARDGGAVEASERAGLVLGRLKNSFVCLNRFPYSSGHVLLVPYRHSDSLAKLDAEEAGELMRSAQQMERVLREVYRPDGVNLGLNLGEAAGAGVANHLHFHMLPRWYGDTNFMTVTAETRILPEALDVTWERLRSAFQGLSLAGSVR